MDGQAHSTAAFAYIREIMVRLSSDVILPGLPVLTG